MSEQNHTISGRCRSRTDKKRSRRQWLAVLAACLCTLAVRGAEERTPGVIGAPAPDYILQEPEETVTVLTKQQKKELRARERAQKKADKKSSRQDLTRDQQQQLNERMKELEGLAVGEHVRVSSGVRGTPVSAEADTIARRARFIQQLPDSLLLVLSQEVPELGYDSLPQLRMLPDSLLAYTFSDSLLVVHVGDSLLRTATFRIAGAQTADTTFLGSGDRLTGELAADSLGAETRTRFRIREDTLPPGRHTFYSAIMPGYGQIYNRQPWKLPVIYGGLAGFITGGVLFHNSYKTREREYDRTVALRLPPEVQSRAYNRMRKAGSGQTLMYAGAALTYFYSVADAVFNYRGVTDPVRKATTLAVVFPGMGFVYTKTYWRLPIYYGGFIALATVVDYNNRNYQRYKKAYDALTDGNPSTVDEFNGRYNADLLARVRSAYRRDRDLAIIGMAAAYLLSIVDTYVIASLKNWDVSDDLTVRVEPTAIQTNLSTNGSGSNRRTSSIGVPSTAYGMAVKIRF